MTPEEKERTIFIGNMPLDANEKTVKKIFSEYGKVIVVIYDFGRINRQK